MRRQQRRRKQAQQQREAAEASAAALVFSCYAAYVFIQADAIASLEEATETEATGAESKQALETPAAL